MGSLASRKRGKEQSAFLGQPFVRQGERRVVLAYIRSVPTGRNRRHRQKRNPVSSPDFAHAIAVLALLALLAFLGYPLFMATIVIRNLDETVKRRLQVRAALNGRSMEAEARAALNDLLEESPTEDARAVKARRDGEGIGTAIHKRFAAPGGVDLKIPPRTFSGRPKDASGLPQLDKDLGTAIHELFAPLGGVELPIPPRRKSRRKVPTFS